MATKVPSQQGTSPAIQPVWGPAIDAPVQLDGLYAAPIGLALIARDLTYTRVSGRFAALHGTDPSAIIGRTVGEVARRSGRPITRAFAGRLEIEVARILGGGGGVALRVTPLSLSVHATADDGGAPGDNAEWSASLHGLVGRGGEVVAVQCVVEDVTDVARAGVALEDRLAFERLITDLSARFVSVPPARLDDEIGLALRRIVEFLGIDRSTLAEFRPDGEVVILKTYAAPGAQTFDHSAVPRSWKWYRRELLAGRVVRLRGAFDLPPDARAEFEHMTATGVRAHIGLPIQVGGLPLYGLGFATIGRDHDFPAEALPRLQLIGEVFANAIARRRADEEMRRMRDELAHVTRVSTVGHLAASIAHELNQPLCAIVSNARAASRLLVMPRPDLTDVGQALQEIAADGRRAGDVVARSHGLMKRQQFDLKALSVNEVVGEVLALLHSDAVIRRVDLRAELADGLATVSADRVQLQQILLNLILNGMEAIGEAQPGPRRVAVRTAAAGGAVRVVVDDTGVGLSPGVLSRMFEPFFTTKRTGLGMGLAINQTIIEAHGGRMWAEPNPAGGASIGFELPVEDGPADGTGGAGHAPPAHYY